MQRRNPRMVVTNEEMKRDLDTNFRNDVYGSKAVVNHFKERGVLSDLINVGTELVDRGIILKSTYSAIKFTVHGWTENLLELEKEKAPKEARIKRGFVKEAFMP